MDKRKDLEDVSYGIMVMFGIFWICSIFIQNKLNSSLMSKTILSLGSLYVLGLLLFMIIIRKIPNTEIKKAKVNWKTILICFFLQFSALMIMNVINTIRGIAVINVQDNLSLYTLFMLLIFNPILEELVFRKFFADKLLKHGELFYMIASSFCFAIVHGVSVGYPQMIYTFLLGLIWSYLVVKTGSIKWSILLHTLSNLFGAIIIYVLQSISLELVIVYSVIIFVCGIIGLVWLIVSKKNISIDNKNKIIDKEVLKDIFTNKGILGYTVFTIAIIIMFNVL